jgi:phage repressor protein C with HTH and peptisase S24 domain
MCGLSNGTAARLRQTTRQSTLDRIANACDLNIQWLLTGEGEMLVTNEPRLAPEISFKEGVPYYDVDFQLGFEEFEGVDNPNPRYLIRMPGYEKATLWCNASGHSMEPEINHGDILALQRINDFSFLPFGDVYGFITTNGMRTIKRLGRSARQGYYRLIPTNKEYDEQEIPISSIEMVYRVMGAMKAF